VHIPDGYLSPASSGAMYLAALPFWATATARARRTLSGRTVPLLAIFAAFAFVIMMFNVPVPGGTTAHAVGGTLAAIVLGPWAAVITTSVALIIQALFFGDGGITAIGANCFNMAIVLPLVGYLGYRLVAGRSAPLSQRRVVAAAVGSYVGITVAALCVGVELGIQPRFWSTGGVPDYSPYNLATAIPAMLAAHAFGASFVEAAVTALAVAYLQRSHPEILLRREPPVGAEGAARRGNAWVPALALVVVAAAAIFLAGLVKGGGDLGRWAGLDWAHVDRAAAGGTVLVSAAVSAVVLPALWFALRRAGAWRPLALIFVGLVTWAPLGLIAPGGAFGEDVSATQAEVTAALAARAAGNPALFDALPQVNRECECVPKGLAGGSYAQHALLSGYEPPWVSRSDPTWQQNVGYQIAGALGVGILTVVGGGLWLFARWLAPTAPPDWRNAV
jgi:cobalt/nickel transport system permease protein